MLEDVMKVANDQANEAELLNARILRIAELKAKVGRGENIVYPERIAKAIVADAFARAA